MENNRTISTERLPPLRAGSRYRNQTDDAKLLFKQSLKEMEKAFQQNSLNLQSKVRRQPKLQKGNPGWYDAK